MDKSANFTDSFSALAPGPYGPEAFEHLIAGVAGAAIAKALASYNNMSKPAQTLLSLAGFGIGNIMYNTLQEHKFTTYDQDTGKSKIKL